MAAMQHYDKPDKPSDDGNRRLENTGVLSDESASLFVL
jgi:hypothetical protein